MEHISVTPDVEMNPWDDLAGRVAHMGKIHRAGVLRHGTRDGRATIAIVVQLEDGNYAIAETTWRLFKAMYTAMAASPVIAEETPD